MKRADERPFPTWMVPTIGVEPGFGATEKPMVPLDAPLTPEFMESHVARLVADQLQPAPVVRVTLPVPPLPLKPAGELETAKEQVAWVGTLNGEPARMLYRT